MQNNSKPPPQTQPSTLDIVFKNGQMNLATAIGRLEQAVTKAYGNINSSINSKQGEFNQALLKTLDQSISKSSNKMDQFYTSSFAKIYALNSTIMEQSLQKNGMAAAQRDLDGYKNYDKLFENQQRAFGDMNASLKQIIEKIAPLNDEQKRVKIHNYSQSRNVGYQHVSAFSQITDRHGVGLEETLKNFDHFNDSFKNRKNIDAFKKDPIIAALVAHNEGLLKELQGTSDISEFIVRIIQALSKAKKEKNETIMQQARKNLSSGMLAAMTDEDIHFISPEELKNKKPEEIQQIYNKNTLSRILTRADREGKLDDIIENNKLSYTATEVQQIKNTNNMASQTAVSLEKKDPENKKYISENNQNPTAKIIEGIKVILGKEFDAKKYDKDLITKLFNYGTTLVPTINAGVATVDLKSAQQLNDQQEKEVAKQLTVNNQTAKINTNNNSIFPITQQPKHWYIPKGSNNQTDLSNRPWVEAVAAGREMPKGFTPNQIANSIFSAPQKMEQITKSITDKISQASDYVKNLQFQKQILSTPKNTIEQRLNVHIALTQNGAARSEYSFEKNITLPQKGNGSVVMLNHHFPQTERGAK